MDYKVITAPTPDNRPVVDSVFKEACRVHHTEHDSLLQNLQEAAVDLIETDTGRLLLSQTIEFKIPSFPSNGGAIICAKTPVTSITSILYTDDSGTSGTPLATSVYELDDYKEAHRIKLKYDQSWPSGTEIIVKVVAGYAAIADIPPRLIEAIKQVGAYMYKNPDNQVHSLPTFVDKLIRPTRIRRYVPSYE